MGKQCEYCKEYKSLEHSSFWDIYINGKNLEINSDFESDNRTSIEINYCPICGEELEVAK